MIKSPKKLSGETITRDCMMTLISKETILIKSIQMGKKFMQTSNTSEREKMSMQMRDSILVKVKNSSQQIQITLRARNCTLMESNISTST